jgi:hypothetical protein
VLAGREGDGRVYGDVGGEQPEGDRDQLLSAPLGLLGVRAGGVEPPQDNESRQRFDERVRAECHQRDRFGDGAGGDRDARLDGPPHKAAAGQEPGSGLEPLGFGVAGRPPDARWGLDDGQQDCDQSQYGDGLTERWPVVIAIALAWVDRLRREPVTARHGVHDERPLEPGFVA